VLPLYDYTVGARTRSWLLLLLGAATTMLLIVCANVAHLTAARASARDREIGTRAAIGAGRPRIVRQLLTETLVHSAIGSALGIALAWLAVQAFRTTLPAEIPRVAAIAVDVRVLAVAITAAAATAILSGIFPAVQSSRPDLIAALRNGQPGVSPSRMRHRFRSTLVVGEIALAVILLVGAGLFIGSFRQLMGVDLGFDPERTLTTTVVVRGEASADAVQPALIEIIDRIRAIPSVQYAAARSGTTALPNGETGVAVTLAVPERAELSLIFLGVVTADYHRAMRIPLRQGRYLDDADGPGGTQVVVINEAAAKTFFPDSDPVGQTLPLTGEPRVVGVVGDVRLGGLESGIAPVAYLPLAQQPAPQATPRASSTLWSGRLVIRTTGEPLAIVPAVRAAVHSVLPGVPIRDTSTVDEILGGLAVQRRLSMQILTLFAMLGLAIAAIGIYGLTAYTVAQRRHEIGVRIALGARRRQVVAPLLRSTATLAAVGLALGAAGAWLLSSTARAFLFQIEPTDMRVFAAALLVLATSALVASALPAHRAATVDPLTALRQE
jgi:predicted permease